MDSGTVKKLVLNIYNRLRKTIWNHTLNFIILIKNFLEIIIPALVKILECQMLILSNVFHLIPIIAILWDLMMTLFII